MCGLRICKKKAVENFLKTHSHYDHIYFFGDGTNDLCGMNTVSNGKVFIRKYHNLEKKLKENPEYQKHITVPISYWQDGRDLIKQL